MISTCTNPDNSVILRQMWDEEFGNKLFDVIVTDVKNGGTFGPRLFIMQIKCEEENRKCREACTYAREMSARGSEIFQALAFNDEDNDEVVEHVDTRDDDPDFNELACCEHSSIIRMRNNSEQVPTIICTSKKACQVFDLPVQQPV